MKNLSQRNTKKRLITLKRKGVHFDSNSGYFFCFYCSVRVSQSEIDKAERHLNTNIHRQCKTDSHWKKRHEKQFTTLNSQFKELSEKIEQLIANQNRTSQSGKHAPISASATEEQVTE